MAVKKSDFDSVFSGVSNIPKDLISDKGLTTSCSVRVWAILEAFISKGKNPPSLRGLAKLCNVSVGSVVRALDNLEEMGWIRREKSGDTSRIDYQLYVVPYEVEYMAQEEMPEIEVGTVTLANRKNTNLTAPRRQFGRNVR